MEKYSEADYEKWADAAKPTMTRSRGSVQPTELEPIEDKTDMDLAGSDPAAEDTRANFSGTSSSAVSGGSPVTDGAAKGMMMAGTATANPYLMGAGLGLQTFSAIQGQNAAEEQAEYQNKVTALNNLSNWARGIRSL